MYRISNHKGIYELDFEDKLATKGSIDNSEFVLEISEKDNTKVKFHKKQHRVDIISMNHLTKEVVLRINGIKHSLKVEDDMDVLLKRLGMQRENGVKMNKLKAPMPGLVLQILIKKGQEIKKGDALVILEAMKMENSIKASTDAVVKKIVCKAGNAVEKNEVLIEFEK